ncbi:efflux transporter outer membrane subunit [Sphingomonas pseudosanguinis]|uniref:Multidrug efflux system outer membrane protein n=1 Tax=Sphingomonas pseudosanguinis TaxID=413712 RepID=A0A7W6AB74_9SPHN|nr:efflux transporter outer membrane subunit [Sphingomonas pseudosanguinis]MBB3878783.1 multidrug efflux system outer membrane protein [Sphingomonas pseudosanguinis]MBN3535966.1 efflux transporter outer membrane subunit [Sphingomonas pseudosanguinis]
MRKAFSRAAAMLALTSALTACNLAPQYRQPIAPVSATYPDAGAGTRTAAEIGWREFFADEQLKAYIAAALANNRDLAQAVARVAQARAQYRIQDAQRLPPLDLSASAARTRIPLNSLGFGDALPGGGDAQNPTSITYNQFALGARVSAFELDFWGRVRNLAEAQRRQYLATVEAERAFRLSLVGQVAATYLQIRAAEEQIALAERTVTSRREGLGIAKRRMDAGVTSSVDYDQAVALLTQAETQLAELRRTVAQSQNLLTVLVGGPITGPLPAGRRLGDQNQFAAIEPGLPSALLVNRPDVLQAEQQLLAANANIVAARAAFLPSISLTGLAGFVSPALSSLIDDNSRQYQVQGAALLPIFDWGRRKAQLNLSRAQADELTAAYQRTVQGAFREVADALVARRRFAEQIEAQTRAVDAQRRLARTARLRYNNGIAIYLEVLDAERNLFSAEQQLLTLRSSALQNDVTLYVALGGGLRETGAASTVPASG